MQCLTESVIANLSLAVISNAINTSGTRKSLAHIGTCETCAHSLTTHLALAKGLGDIARISESAQDTAECLDENSLAEFIDNALTKEEYNMTLSHLAKCQYCVSQLSELVTCLQDIDPAPLSYLFKRVKNGLKVILHPDEGFTLLTHEPAVVLDVKAPQTNIQSWIQKANDCSLRVDLQELENDLFSIQVRVTLDNDEAGVVQVIIRVDGNIIQAQPLPDTNRIRLDSLPPQTYEFEIIPSKGSATIFDLTLE